ncbi:CLUMA_CG021554, isoform A [Clunio marinus]|uniref:CLUMA_CG021554, isoform A n=1 Tax=Clunio marinus TaxID=568069 RepID=A0A1J1J7L8_9DIPT|nr:CLUMA_CG021554, isoform A [Clunio marinus]
MKKEKTNLTNRMMSEEDCDICCVKLSTRRRHMIRDVLKLRLLYLMLKFNLKLQKSSEILKS